MKYDWLPTFFNNYKVVRHVCGAEIQNTTRFRPAVPNQKRVMKVWRPKQTVQNQSAKTKEPPVTVTVNPVVAPNTNIVPDTQPPQHVPAQDDGWRVVTMRNKEARTPITQVGLAQVQEGVGFQFGDEGRGGSGVSTFPP